MYRDGTVGDLEVHAAATKKRWPALKWLSIVSIIVAGMTGYAFMGIWTHDTVLPWHSETGKVEHVSQHGIEQARIEGAIWPVTWPVRGIGWVAINAYRQKVAVLIGAIVVSLAWQVQVLFRQYRAERFRRL